MKICSNKLVNSSLNSRPRYPSTPSEILNVFLPHVQQIHHGCNLQRKHALKNETKRNIKLYIFEDGVAWSFARYVENTFFTHQNMVMLQQIYLCKILPAAMQFSPLLNIQAINP